MGPGEGYRRSDEKDLPVPKARLPSPDFQPLPNMPTTLIRPHSWRKRATMCCALAMVAGAFLAFDLPPSHFIVRLAVGLDLMIVAALLLVLVRLSRAEVAPE